MRALGSEIGIQPVVSWPRQVRPGGSYLITVDLRLSDSTVHWPYDQEEFVVGCMLDGRPACTVRALGDACVVLHRFGGTYGPARFLAEVPEDYTELTDAALCLTLTTAGGLPFYTRLLPLAGSRVSDTGPEILVAELSPARNAGNAIVQHHNWRIAVEQSFRDRADETDRVIHALTHAAGPHFWLVVAPPQLGKTWFMEHLSVKLREFDAWTTSWVDIRDQPSSVRSDAMTILRRFFELDAPTRDQGEGAQEIRLIARSILVDGMPRLCLLDSAELLEEETATQLRKYFSDIYRLVQGAGSSDIRLALIVGSRRDDEWRGVTPAPRISTLAISEFEIDVVQFALQELANQARHEFNRQQLSQFATWVYDLSQGLPGLVRECLNWIRDERWENMERLRGPDLFGQLGRPYIRRSLLSRESLQPSDPERSTGRGLAALEQALRVLAPYRLFTQSHLRHHWDRDHDLADALNDVAWSMEDLWTEVSDTALLVRPLDEPWQAIQPAIRRLLYRYFYQSDEDREQAHWRARQFMQIWADGQTGREQVIGLVECLWHEASALTFGETEDIQERLCESALELVRTLRLSPLYTVAELRMSAVRRLRNDEEFQETISRVDGLFGKVIQIMTPTGNAEAGGY